MDGEADVNSKRARLIRKQAVEVAESINQPERWKELYKRGKRHYKRTGEMIKDVVGRLCETNPNRL